MGKNARTACQKCGQLGFFKNHAGLCKNCTPPCEFCTHLIAGWKGEKMHVSCAKRKHQGLSPKRRKAAKPKPKPKQDQVLPAKKPTALLTLTL